MGANLNFAFSSSLYLTLSVFSLSLSLVHRQGQGKSRGAAAAGQHLQPSLPLASTTTLLAPQNHSNSRHPLHLFPLFSADVGQASCHRKIGRRPCTITQLLTAAASLHPRAPPEPSRAISCPPERPRAPSLSRRLCHGRRANLTVASLPRGYYRSLACCSKLLALPCCSPACRFLISWAGRVGTYRHCRSIPPPTPSPTKPHLCHVSTSTEHLVMLAMSSWSPSSHPFKSYHAIIVRSSSCRWCGVAVRHGRRCAEGGCSSCSARVWQ
jgi:hypothetical protein